MEKFFIFISCIGLIACGASNEQSQHSASGAESLSGQQNSASDSDLEKSTDGDTQKAAGQNMPPFELFEENIRATHVSAYVEIVKSAVDDPMPEGGYVNHVYTVKVLDAVYGNPPAEFSYEVMADRGISPIKASTRLFVSLCRAEKGKYYSPDNGYVLDVSQDILGKLKADFKEGTKSSGAACQ